MTHPYATAEYAKGLAHVGKTLAVPEWDGHVLVRAIPHGERRDATGPYPLMAIRRNADLEAGFQRLKDAGLVSAVFVFDDHLRPPVTVLKNGFDLVRPFKTHHLYDRILGPLVYGKHHRYELRRALARVEAVEIVLADHLDAWKALYGQLADRHGLSGLHAFPTTHHDTLARLDGVRAFGAFVEGRLVSAHIFVVHDGYAISHLAASSAEGYASGAAYAVNDAAVRGLANCTLINFGGGAGFAEDAGDGLVRFKKGFSNSAAQSYLCGKVLDRAAYDALGAGFDRDGFFPAYRGARHADQG